MSKEGDRTDTDHSSPPDIFFKMIEIGRQNNNKFKFVPHKFKLVKYHNYKQRRPPSKKNSDTTQQKESKRKEVGL